MNMTGTARRAARTKVAPNDAVVGEAARMQRAYNGRQPGDPARAAQVLIKIAAMDDPPFRLPLGTDALQALERADRTRTDELRRWWALSAATDF